MNFSWRTLSILILSLMAQETSTTYSFTFLAEGACVNVSTGCKPGTTGTGMFYAPAFNLAVANITAQSKNGDLNLTYDYYNMYERKPTDVKNDYK